MRLQDVEPAREEVLDKDGVLGVIRLEDRSEEARDFFSWRGKLDELACRTLSVSDTRRKERRGNVPL